MGKRFAGWGIAIISIVVFGLLLMVGRGAKTTFEDAIVSKDKWYELMSQREKVDGLIEKVSFNKQELMTAEGKTEWYYTLVERQEQAKNPEIEYKGKQEANLAVLEEKITEQIVEDAQVIKVMAYTDEEYALYELRVTTLPIMKINHTGRAELTEEKEEENMTMELFDNSKGATQRYVLTDGKIRARGASSIGFPKKGFRLKLRTTSVGESKRPNNTALLGMRQDDDWILYAGYADQEKIRNVFTTNLWKEGQAQNNEFGIDNGTEYKYVELIMNDEYYGLYALGYPIDELQLQLKMGEDGKYEEFSFKKSEWDFATANYLDTYELKTEVAEPRTAWAELSSLRTKLQYGRNTEEIREAVDMKTVIDLRLLVEMTQGTDTVSNDLAEGDDTKNIYLTYKTDGTEGKWLFTPWDLDLTFGNVWEGQYFYRASDDLEVSGDVVSKLEALGDAKIKEELKERYVELRSGAWADEKIEEILDEYEAEIYESGAFRRDQERWPEGNYNEAAEKLSKFKTYVLTRLEVMDQKYL